LKHSYLSNIKDPEELPKEVIQRITSLQHFSLNGWLKARNHSCCLDRSNCPIYSTNSQFYSSNTLKDIHLCFLILTVSQIYWTPRANEYHYCFVLWVYGVQHLARRQANVTGTYFYSHFLQAISQIFSPDFTTADVQSKEVRAVNHNQIFHYVTV
jgi:hypothetical protein